MRIVDVSAFYSPAGGGVRTYVEAKLRAAPRFGHEMVVVVPGPCNAVERRGPNAFLVSIASPTLPVDRRYRYFDDQKALHRTLDQWSPDHVEASSPWSSATMVGRWDGLASRSLVMHADPMSAYAYRWLGGVARIETIDRWFHAFWRHLRGLGQMFDAVICANAELTGRLSKRGLDNSKTIAMGVEPGRFSPACRSAELRAAALGALGLEPDATLLVGVGRFSGEKRWEMVIRAMEAVGRECPIGLLLVGDGPRRAKLEVMASRLDHVAILPRLDDRDEMARLLASADGLVHACEAETFCLVAAEARASGIPMIVPDRGAAVDLLAPHAGHAFRAASASSLRRTIAQFVEGGVELQRAAAVRASQVRTIDEHFDDLFAFYARLASAPALRSVQIAQQSDAPRVPDLAVAGSGARHS